MYNFCAAGQAALDLEEVVLIPVWLRKCLSDFTGTCTMLTYDKTTKLASKHACKKQEHRLYSKLKPIFQLPCAFHGTEITTYKWAVVVC